MSLLEVLLWLSLGCYLVGVQLDSLRVVLLGLWTQFLAMAAIMVESSPAMAAVVALLGAACCGLVQQCATPGRLANPR